jgi:hypothetical protein
MPDLADFSAAVRLRRSAAAPKPEGAEKTTEIRTIAE